MTQELNGSSSPLWLGKIHLYKCNNARKRSPYGLPFFVDYFYIIRKLLQKKSEYTVLTKVGATGFEPATSRPPAERATKLRHTPGTEIIIPETGKKATGKYRQKHTEKEKDPQIPQVLSISYKKEWALAHSRASCGRLRQSTSSRECASLARQCLLPSALHSPRGSRTLWPP